MFNTYFSQPFIRGMLAAGQWWWFIAVFICVVLLGLSFQPSFIVTVVHLRSNFLFLLFFFFFLLFLGG